MTNFKKVSGAGAGSTKSCFSWLNRLSIYKPGFWIRIRIQWLLYLDSESGSRIRIQRLLNKEKNYFFCILKFCCGSAGSGSALDPDSMALWIRVCIRIQIELKWFTRIRIQIEFNPGPNPAQEFWKYPWKFRETQTQSDNRGIFLKYSLWNL
jgi:hypothetical protein